MIETDLLQLIRHSSYCLCFLLCIRLLEGGCSAMSPNGSGVRIIRQCGPECVHARPSAAGEQQLRRWQNDLENSSFCTRSPHIFQRLHWLDGLLQGDRQFFHQPAEQLLCLGTDCVGTRTCFPTVSCITGASRRLPYKSLDPVCTSAAEKLRDIWHVRPVATLRLYQRCQPVHF